MYVLAPREADTGLERLNMKISTNTREQRGKET
jgi:hypothetical protein